MKEIIEKAAEVIREGGIILYPTDTIWGIGCDPSNEEAVQKIISLKERDGSKSLIILVHSEALLNRYAKVIPEICYDIIDNAERPITIIYPQGQFVSNEIMADDQSIAIRLTNNEICSQIMTLAKCGLVSTSANISGQPFPKGLTSVDKKILDGVDYVVNLPLKSDSSKPSQIIKIGEKGEVEIIRK